MGFWLVPSLWGRDAHFIEKVSPFLSFCFWLCWVFVAVWVFLQLWRAVLLSSYGIKTKASTKRTRGGESWASHSGAQAGSCGAWAWLLHGMWDLPGSGIEPMSLALAGGFFTTEPPGNTEPFFSKLACIFRLGHVCKAGGPPSLTLSITDAWSDKWDRCWPLSVLSGRPDSASGKPVWSVGGAGGVRVQMGVPVLPAAFLPPAPQRLDAPLGLRLGQGTCQAFRISS